MFIIIQAINIYIINDIIKGCDSKVDTNETTTLH